MSENSPVASNPCSLSGRRLKVPLFYRTEILARQSQGFDIPVEDVVSSAVKTPARAGQRTLGGTLGSLVVHQVLPGGAKSPPVSPEIVRFRGGEEWETVGRLLGAFGSESGAEVWGVQVAAPGVGSTPRTGVFLEVSEGPS